MQQTNVLLLQGPLGSFFARYARFLMHRGNKVWKVNFNGGDLLFNGPATPINYRGSLSDWPAFFAEILATHQIGRLYLFGDCRKYHREAIRVAEQSDVRVFVFEEGYIRPDFITLEESGVNGFSRLPRNPTFYRQRPALPDSQPTQPAKTSFQRMALSAMAYYAAGMVMRPMFWKYQHHRSFSVPRKMFIWTRSGMRKLFVTRRDSALTRLLAERSKRYFLVPLQVHNDSQVIHHSDYEDISAFIEEVVRSFARHANKDYWLVFKHHPMDRGARHYGALIDRLAAENKIGGRVLYGHQMHLPTLLDHARGVVVINSTVGLSALLHGAPVKVMGKAIYDMPGLTCQSSLQRFWREPGKIDARLHAAFRRYLIEQTQVNGSFYGLEPFPLLESLDEQRNQLDAMADYFLQRRA